MELKRRKEKTKNKKRNKKELRNPNYAEEKGSNVTKKMSMKRHRKKWREKKRN